MEHRASLVKHLVRTNSLKDTAPANLEKLYWKEPPSTLLHLLIQLIFVPLTESKSQISCDCKISKVSTMIEATIFQDYNSLLSRGVTESIKGTS